MTVAAGRRAVKLPVIGVGMLALTAALSLGVLSTASLAIVVMLCLTTAARSVLWTVSYPLAAEAAGRRGTGLGAAVGLLNGIWAATAVLGPLAAGLAAEHLSARAAFGLTEVACAAALAVTTATAWPVRHPTRGSPLPFCQPGDLQVQASLQPLPGGGADRAVLEETG
jgi:MFS family permease